jgi:undecaprenyl-diphosphatase
MPLDSQATGPSHARPTLLARLVGLDSAISSSVATRWPHPRWFTLPLSALTLTANYGILWFVLAALPWLFGDSVPLPRFLYVALPVFATEIITFLVKSAIGRRRPSLDNPATRAQIPLPRSHSFPSSHASMGMCGLLVLGHLYPGWIPALAALVAVLAISRVYLAVHYLGDVIAGLILGTALALGYLYVLVPLR